MPEKKPAHNKQQPSPAKPVAKPAIKPLKKPGEIYLKSVKPEKPETLPEEPPKKPEKKKLKFKPSKKLIIISLSALILLAGATTAAIFLIKNNSSNKPALTESLKSLGSDFYENYYYVQLKEAYEGEKLTEFLEKYKDTGIKVNLDNLERYPSPDLDNKSLVAEFINNKTEEKCDSVETKVSIYPEPPYSATSYRLEQSLSCNFTE
ncbi:hypothetical protein FACS1894191_7370 [Clostridia bacterium]|nr:hypothetical protein FACS1894191_7370 [Clostridia bacterium]